VFQKSIPIPEDIFVNKDNYMQYLYSICPEFNIICNCANAHKHLYLDANNRLINSAKQLNETLVITSYVDEQGTYSIVEKEIIVHLNDENTVDLHECLNSVRHMWSSELIRLGIIGINDVHPPETLRSYPPLREPDNDGKLPTIFGKRSEGLQILFLFRKFNYNTMKPENVSVDPANMQGFIYSAG
jgi:hypothetical protein